MKFKRINLLVALLISALSVNAETQLRYNVIGYPSKAPKRLIIMSDDNFNGEKWTMRDSSGEKVLKGALGKSIAKQGPHTPLANNYELRFDTIAISGRYQIEIGKLPPCTVVVRDNPYGFVMESMLRWLRAARSGSRESVDHLPSHYGDTSCAVWVRHKSFNDQWHPDTITPRKVNVVGGWYDAGDYLKFAMTNAYTAYFLLRSYETAPKLFTKKLSKTEFPDILDEAKFGLDFLTRLMPDSDSNTFIIQVGGEEDHNVGIRLPENDELNGKRPALAALSLPQMGYTAAALALGASVFDSLGKPLLAKRYRSKAEQIYRRATAKGVSPNPAFLMAEANPFYDDETPYDNMELAAIELYRLTGDTLYAADAQKYENLARVTGWASWGDINAVAHLRLMGDYPIARQDVMMDLNKYLGHATTTGNIWRLPISYVWGGLYCYMEIGAIALEYERLTKDNRYRSMGVSMVDYLCGTNNWGVAMVALKGYPTIRNPYSQIYRLQTSNKFPYGAVAEGPSDRKSHKEQSAWFGFDVRCEPTEPYNTNAAIFYDNVNDYMSMETTISGVADGIYLLTLASKLFGSVP